MQNNVNIQICTNDLKERTVTEMWSVYAPFYHYSETDFRARISRNTHYALYRQAGRIVGFTGLRIEKVDLRDDKFLTIYFGQTVVMNHVRGKGLINRTGLLLTIKFWRSFLMRKVVFWADALTYRAYLVFAKNLVECYPRRHRLLPERMRNLRDYLGYVNYGDRYCPHSGTVTKDNFMVRDPRVTISPQKLADRDVSFYVQANPNHRNGQGLLTMGTGTWENLKFMLQKAFAKRRNQTEPMALRPPRTIARSSAIAN